MIVSSDAVLTVMAALCDVMETGRLPNRAARDQIAAAAKVLIAAAHDDEAWPS